MINIASNTSKILKIEYITSFFLVFATVFLSIFNHKELFSLQTWSLLPVRFVLLLVILFGFYISVKYKKLIDFNFILLAFLCGFLALTVTISFNKIDSILFTVFYSSLPFIYILFKYISNKDKNWIDHFINVYLITYFISLLFVIAQIIYYYSTGKLFGAIWPVPNNTPRFGSLFWDINHYGMFITINIWLLFYKLLIKKTKKFLSFLYFFLILLSFVSLYLTSSRSAILGLMAGSFIFITLYILFLQPKIKTVAYNFFSSIMILMPFFIYFFAIVFGDLVRNFFFYRIHSFFTHFILIAIGFSLFKDNPLLGIGANNFDYALKNSKYINEFALLDPGALNYKIPIHSVWMHFLTEGGIFTFLTFLLIVVTTLYMLVNLVKNSKDILALVLISSFVSMLVSGIFYSYNLEFYWLYFVFILFYSFSKYSYKTKNITKIIISFVSLRVLILVLTFLSLLYIISNISLYPSLLEIQFFNASKNYVDFNLYSFSSSLLSRLQFMLGYFPYVARLVPLFFYLSTVYLLFFILKKHRLLVRVSFGFFVATLFYTLFNGFILGNVSYYLYLSFVVIGILALFFGISKKIPSQFFTNISLLVFTCLSLFLVVLAFNSLKENSYKSNVSSLTNAVSRKYSISNFNIVVPDQKNLEAVTFYLEPYTIVSSDYTNLDTDIIYVSNTPPTFLYERVVEGNGINAYIKFKVEDAEKN